MKIELRVHGCGGRSILVDGEDTELMSPKRRTWIMQRLMVHLDHRYLETIAGAIADKFGEVMPEDDFDLYIHELDPADRINYL